MSNRTVLYVMAALLGLPLLAAAGSSVNDPPGLWVASDLIGLEVVSQEGDDLGKIEDVVVHPGGGPSYAVLSFGGWLGMGDKLFAMPWTVLRTVEADTAKKGSARSLVLPLDEKQLKAAPGFDPDNWPAMANPDWTRDVDTFYAGAVNPNAGKPVAGVARPKQVLTWRVTELTGTEVETPTGEELGEIEEVAIDYNGRVCYVALSVGGFLGVGDRLVGVPWDSLVFALEGDDGDEKLITLASTKERLEQAPQFKAGKENRAAMCDPMWVQGLYQNYSCPAYWNAEADREAHGG
jgi:sporulation protein YlmC with PRC-barrel domain